MSIDGQRDTGFSLGELDLSELSVTVMRDAVDVPETGATSGSSSCTTCSTCGSSSCCADQEVQ